VKRAASILLLGILAFNWVGYRFVSQYLEHKADIVLETRIDNAEYDESSLIEIRVPLNAPYISAGNSTEFERFYGELEVEGVHYKYVKRKIDNGELVLLCLPNENKARFQNSRVDFFKLVNDLNNTSQSKEKNNSSSVKSFTTEYKQENNSWSIKPFTQLRFHYFTANTRACAAGFANIPEQPPKDC
jgi:hypothetical protein